MTTHTLYRFFGGEEELLYVGITNNPPRRFAKHQQEKDWWPKVARIHLEQYESRDELVAAEKQAVMDERPVHNIRMNDSGPAPGEETNDAFVGRWFHSWYYDDGKKKPQTQGQVRDGTRDGYFVKHYSWWDGAAISGEEWIPLEEMRDWTFYHSAQEMVVALRCSEDFGNGRRHRGRDGVCGDPITHVIREYADMGPIYRCGECIKYYAGTIEEL